MGRLDKVMTAGRLIGRIRTLERDTPGSAVLELRKLFADPARSQAIVVPLLLGLRRFAPAAAVLLPLVEKLTQPEEAENVRRMATSVIDAMRHGDRDRQLRGEE